MSKLLIEVAKNIKNWWIYILLGSILITGSIYVFIHPMKSYINLALFFSILIIINGVLNVSLAAANYMSKKRWERQFGGGVFEILIGIVLMLYPGITMATLPIFLGFWIMYGAISIISGSLELKSYKIDGWVYAMATGVLILLCSLFVITEQFFGMGTIIIMTSLAILFYGIGSIIIGFQMKKVNSTASDVVENIKLRIKDLQTEVLTSIEDDLEANPYQDEIIIKLDSFKE